MAYWLGLRPNNPVLHVLVGGSRLLMVYGPLAPEPARARLPPLSGCAACCAALLWSMVLTNVSHLILKVFNGLDSARGKDFEPVAVVVKGIREVEDAQVLSSGGGNTTPSVAPSPGSS